MGEKEVQHNVRPKCGGKTPSNGVPKTPMIFNTTPKDIKKENCTKKQEGASQEKETHFKKANPNKKGNIRKNTKLARGQPR